MLLLAVEARLAQLRQLASGQPSACRRACGAIDRKYVAFYLMGYFCSGFGDGMISQTYETQGQSALVREMFLFTAEPWHYE